MKTRVLVAGIALMFALPLQAQERPRGPAGGRDQTQDDEPRAAWTVSDRRAGLVILCLCPGRPRVPRGGRSMCREHAMPRPIACGGRGGVPRDRRGGV